MPKKKIPSFHVVLIGDKNVGKYSLREQFVKGWIAPKDFQAPPGPASKILVHNKKKVEVTVSCFRDLENTNEALESCHGIILVYNISDKNSLDYIRNQAVPFLLRPSGEKEQMVESTDGEDDAAEVEMKDLGKPVVLVGNKADEAKLSRKVSAEDGEKLSVDRKFEGFFETSATCNENVQRAFETLTLKMLENAEKDAPISEKKKKSKCVIL